MICLLFYLDVIIEPLHLPPQLSALSPLGRMWEFALKNAVVVTRLRLVKPSHSAAIAVPIAINEWFLVTKRLVLARRVPGQPGQNAPVHAVEDISPAHGESAAHVRE